MFRRAPILRVAAWLLAACTRPSTTEEGPAPSEAEAESAKPQRRGAPDFRAGRPAMPEPPAGTPFVGEAGDDVHGYPLRRPDKIALRSMLLLRRFAELDAAFAAYQDALERDHRKEAWPLDALEAFDVADPDLAPHLDAWVEASPKSFAPWAARGSFRYGMGWGARGHDYTLETKPEQFAEMERLHGQAVADLEHALSLRPRLVAARHLLIGIARTAGDDAAMRIHLERGLAECPLCFELRLTYTMGKGPLWGGSHAQMDALAKQSQAEAAANPKMAVLAGVSAWDRCRSLYKEKDYDAALTACDEALAAAEHPMFLCTKARVLNVQKRYRLSIPLLDAALRLHPQARDCLFARATARGNSKQIVAGAGDLLAARRLDHVPDDTKGSLDWYLQKLRWDAQEANKAGDRATAEELLALASELAPGSAAVADLKDALHAAEDAAALKTKLADAPDDFELRIELDLVLAKQRRFDEIVAMWDAFIADHPDHARAYRERGGARWHARDHQGAIADTQRACDLDLTAACGDVPKMRARAPK